MKPLCMAHWDRPMKDCRLCQMQRKIQEIIRHGVAPGRIAEYLEEQTVKDMTELDARVKAEGL